MTTEKEELVLLYALVFGRGLQPKASHFNHPRVYDLALRIANAHETLAEAETDLRFLCVELEVINKEEKIQWKD